MKTKHSCLTAALCGAILAVPLAGKADTSFTITNTDTFLAGSSPSLNYGSAGTLAIAPASSPKGEFDSVIKFNFGSAISQFNATYGAGNWHITDFTLQLASSFGTNGAIPGNSNLNPVSGGNFGIDWLAGDNWTEGNGNGNGAANGATSFSSISALFSAGFDPLGTFTYTPPGNNVYAIYILPLNTALLTDATAGGDVSLYFFAADNQVSYLFNSRTFSTSNPQLIVTAVPEPGAALMSISLAGFLLSRRPKRKK